MEKPTKQLAVELMSAYLNYLAMNNTGTKGLPSPLIKASEVIDWTMEYEHRLSGGEKSKSNQNQEAGDS